MHHDLTPRLRMYGQEHLLAFWDQLDAAARQRLNDEIESVDLELISRLMREPGADGDWRALAARAKSPPAIRLGQPNRFSADEAIACGRAALSAGQVGVILVAGGQGTRLGFDHPKGMFPVGPVSRAPLFQILLEKILARSRAAGASLPLYLMTSPATHGETVAFLLQQKNFGLPPADVRIFCQGTMPAVDAATGKLLLADRGSLSLSPDGHGGTLAALDRSGALADIRQRGVEHLFYLQVDNPLVPLGDPAFLGYHVLAKSEMSTKVLAKSGSRDKVGNVVEIDGRLQIIEYSDLNPLPDEIVERRTSQGTPVFWAGNAAVHVLAVEFLTRMASSAAALPFHRAYKAVPYVDPATGSLVKPAAPNAIKFERFIFDLLPKAQQPIVVEMDEASEFAPVKNAPGEARDTPETVARQMIALHRGWLRAAQVQVADDVPVEISPLFAQDAAEVAARVRPGLVVTEPHYFVNQ